MIITDTHAHLYIEAFDQDRDAMIKRAMTEGVERFFLPAIDSTYTQSMLELKQAYPDYMYMMMGLHPTHVKENYKDELKHVKEQLESGNYVAVGEIGIDLYWDKSTLHIQQEAFRFQIGLAKSHQLPIVIHSRESFDEIFEILEEEQVDQDQLRGIFHCFTGNLEQAKRAIDLNMKLGIGGVVTFKNGKIDKFLDQIELEHIVLETDAPYLAPAPFRGKRNESAYIIHVLNKLSEIYGKSTAEIADITTENSKSLFKI
ncbi:MAG: TatD family hydrolase [Flavobacteriaceae bacterium]|nr:TatD family hydrolase [Bacteroidia bacterium]NNK88701.1 TatD family hydrolase [Flavobacteriaceae bacterium]